MSIWCSHETIGWDHWVSKPNKMRRGQVRSYANGWSNHYPDTEVEQPASIDLANISPWCVPGREENDGLNSKGEYCVGPWLRMIVDSWEHDYHEPERITKRVHAAVVMDEKAVRSLVAQLTEWLETPKMRPKKGVA